MKLHKYTLEQLKKSVESSNSISRWIIKNENSKWKSTTVTIELFGIVDSLSGWSKRIGFHRNYLCKHRSKYGMVSCINLIKEIMHP